MKNMTISSVGVCTICQDPIPTSGIGYWVNQLFPQKHVRKLDGCNHKIHSSCFQNYVNHKLATNYDHRGLVKCPECKKKSQGVHSLQDTFKWIPSPFTIGYIVTTVAGGMQGLGVGLLTYSSGNTEKAGKIPFIITGLASIIARGLLHNPLETPSKNNT
jgi:hypothetical protein